MAAPAPKFDDGEDFGLRIGVFGAALNPVHSLDSNGVEAVRRYDLSAFSAGAGLEVDARNLGPVAVRAGYTIAFLSDLTSDEVPGAGGAGGFQHNAYARVGMPFSLWGLQLTPEVGYHLGIFDFDAVLANQQEQVVFLSTQSHAGTLGFRVQAVLLDGVILDADAAGLLGITQETPRDLGDAGLTVGFSGQLGLRILLTDSLSLLARYAANYRSTSYSGTAQLDETITEATLTDIAHGLLAGVAIDL